MAVSQADEVADLFRQIFQLVLWDVQLTQLRQLTDLLKSTARKLVNAIKYNMQNGVTCDISVGVHLYSSQSQQKYLMCCIHKCKANINVFKCCLIVSWPTAGSHKSARRMQTSTEANPVQIWIRIASKNVGVMGISLPADTSVIKFSRRSDQFFRRCELNCGKTFAMLKNPSKEFLDPDPEADDFQNLISSSLCTDTAVTFMKIHSVVFP